MAWPNVLMETQLVKLSLPVLFENFIVLSKTLCTSLCDPHGGPGSIDPVNTSCRARHTCPSSPQVFYLFSPKKKKGKHHKNRQRRNWPVLDSVSRERELT